MKTWEVLSDKEKFIFARWAYSVGQPVISDAEYSSLLHAMENMYPDDEYVKRSWSSDPCPTDLLVELNRRDLIYSVVLTDKTESIPSLNTDIDVYNTLHNITQKGTLSMKHDGWNVQINYYNGHIVNIMTRGRSTDAVDVSKLRHMVPNVIPFNGKCKVVCELTVSLENFETCKRLFNNANPRSAVSSVLARPEYYHLLDITAFDVHGYTLDGECKFKVLADWGFNTPLYYEVSTYDTLLYYLSELSNQSGWYAHPTDGVVYDGESRHAIRLLAWEEPIYRSYVTGYLEQYGPYRISPSVTIFPIDRNGTKQRRLSLTNWQRILDYHLEPGAPVAFRVASGTNADFDEEATRLLHKEWLGRWDVYKRWVEDNEEMITCQKHFTQ